MTLPVAILAGGLGTRLGDLARDLPKALVPVLGRPFLFHQLDLLRESGIRRVVLLIGHRGDAIRDAVSRGDLGEVEVRFVSDPPGLLGTGGAIRNALPELGDAFFTLYGDSYLDIDARRVEAAFRESGKAGLMTVFRNEGRWDTSNTLFEEGRILRYDKERPDPRMQHIDYGLNVLTAAALEEFPAGTRFDLSEVHRRLIERGQLAGFEATRRFYEIGSPAGLADFTRFLEERKGPKP